MHKDMSRFLCAVALMSLGLSSVQAMEADHQHAAHHDTHAEHRQMAAQVGYQRSEHRYPELPITLTAANGDPAPLAELLAGDRPVMLNFIYTSCTTICPVMSATFSEVRRHLGPDGSTVRMVSISIDPEVDTPDRLRAYAARFNADPEWRLLTGDSDAIVRVQRAFDIYRGAKTSHIPATFLRTAGSDSWVRLEGLTTAAELADEYRRLAAE